MAANIEKITLCYSDIVQGGTACKNPDVRWEFDSNILSNCPDGNCPCVQIQVLPGAEKACFNLIVDCEDCDTCPPQIITKCLCDLGDLGSCDPCHVCVGNICTSVCSATQKCDTVNDVCVDECINASDCDGVKVCVGGICQCPPDKPYVDTTGKCRECQNDTHCPPCTTCLEGTCVPFDCFTGQCDPTQNKCVECVDDSPCKDKDPNSCCNGENECDCCAGFEYNVTTRLCEPIDECKKASDCPACKRCVGGDCVPVTCPTGYTCYNDECVPECDCNDPTCPRGESCTPWGSNTCVCLPCEGDCVNNSDCTGLGCYCNPNSGKCEPSPCSNVVCNGSEDCGQGCGCYLGECIPCSSIDCAVDPSVCANTLGCECSGNNCVPSNCGNTCTSFADCGEGCTCDDGICKSCSSFSCNDCTTHPGCECISGKCVDDPDCSNDELFVCQPATYTDNTTCAKVFLAMDTSAAVSTEAAAFNQEIPRFVNRLGNNAGAAYQTKVVGYNQNQTDITSGFVSSSPNLSLSYTGGNNYTGVLQQGYDDLLANKTANIGDGCRRILVLFTSSPQNSDDGSIGLGGTSRSALDTEAISIADQARAQGFEVITVAYGANATDDNCSTLTGIAGSDNNVILAADNNPNILPSLGNGGGPAAAFDKLYNKITRTKTASAQCRPATAADVANGMQVFCSGDCPKCTDEGYGGYLCTAHGCTFNSAGTSTKAQCCTNCQPDLRWVCGVETAGCTAGLTGPYTDQALCIDECVCQISASANYNCQLGRLSYVVVTNYSYRVDIYNSAGALVAQRAETDLTPIVLSSGTYRLVAVNLAVAGCTAEVTGINVQCCVTNTLGITTLYDDPVACGEINPSASFVFTGGTPAYSYTVKDASATTVASGSVPNSGGSTGSIVLDLSEAHTVTITDAAGCTATANIAAQTASSYSVTINSFEKCDNGNNKINYSVTAVNGTGPYEVRFFASTDTIDCPYTAGGTVIHSRTAVSSSTITGSFTSAVTSFKVCIQDANGCGEQQTLGLTTVTPATCTGSILPVEACEAQPLTLAIRVNGNLGGTLATTVSTPSVSAIVYNNTVLPGQTVHVVTGTTFTGDPSEDITVSAVFTSNDGSCQTCTIAETIDVLETGSCCTETCSILINGAAGVGTVSVDQGDSVQLTIDTGAVPTAYEWTINGVVQPSTGGLLTLDTSVPGTYDVEVEITYYGSTCTTTCSQTIEVEDTTGGLIVTQLQERACLSGFVAADGVLDFRVEAAYTATCANWTVDGSIATKANPTVPIHTASTGLEPTDIVGLSTSNPVNIEVDVTDSPLVPGTDYVLTLTFTQVGCDAQVVEFEFDFVTLSQEVCDPGSCTCVVMNMTRTDSAGNPISNLPASPGDIVYIKVSKGCGPVPPTNPVLSHLTGTLGSTATIITQPVAANNWVGTVQLGTVVELGWEFGSTDSCPGGTPNVGSTNFFIPFSGLGGGSGGSESV